MTDVVLVAVTFIEVMLRIVGIGLVLCLGVALLLVIISAPQILEFMRRWKESEEREKASAEARIRAEQRQAEALAAEKEEEARWRAAPKHSRCRKDNFIYPYYLLRCPICGKSDDEEAILA